jgi:hypothetical protein
LTGAAAASGATTIHKILVRGLRLDTGASNARNPLSARRRFSGETNLSSDEMQASQSIYRLASGLGLEHYP